MQRLKDFKGILYSIANIVITLDTSITFGCTNMYGTTYRWYRKCLIRRENFVSARVDASMKLQSAFRMMKDRRVYLSTIGAVVVIQSMYTLVVFLTLFEVYY